MSKEQEFKEMLKLYSKQDLWNRIQEKQTTIYELEVKITITEKALELACEHIKEDLKCDDTQDEIYNYFKNKAKEMLENEQNNRKS